MFKAVIFDLNGTLFEDYDLQEDAWKEVFRVHFGRELGADEFRDHFFGYGNVDILHYLNGLDPEKQFDISVTDEKETVYRDICRKQPERAKLIPGAAETFDALKAAGIPFAIGTACEIKNVEFIYEIFRLDRWFRPEHIIYDDRTFPLKPAPDVFLKAMERLGTAPEDCVICEDSKSGLTAAVRSGAGRVIARRSETSDPSLFADPKIYAVIDDFTGFYPRYLE